MVVETDRTPSAGEDIVFYIRQDMAWVDFCDF
jgi:hypothetical protein